MGLKMSISVLPTAINQKLASQHSERKRKQISRIIKYLRGQLPSEKTTQHLPSDWLIEQLVNNALAHSVPNGDDWHQTIYSTLKTIVNTINKQPFFYYRANQKIPLFPNEEHLDIWQVKAFSLRLLALLNDHDFHFKH